MLFRSSPFSTTTAFISFKNTLFSCIFFFSAKHTLFGISLDATVDLLDSGEGVFRRFLGGDGVSLLLSAILFTSVTFLVLE